MLILLKPEVPSHGRGHRFNPYSAHHFSPHFAGFFISNFITHDIS